MYIMPPARLISKATACMGLTSARAGTWPVMATQIAAASTFTAACAANWISHWDPLFIGLRQTTLARVEQVTGRVYVSIADRVKVKTIKPSVTCSTPREGGLAQANKQWIPNGISQLAAHAAGKGTGRCDLRRHNRPGSGRVRWSTPYKLLLSKLTWPEA